MLFNSTFSSEQYPFKPLLRITINISSPMAPIGRPGTGTSTGLPARVGQNMQMVCNLDRVLNIQRKARNLQNLQNCHNFKDRHWGWMEALLSYEQRKFVLLPQLMDYVSGKSCEQLFAEVGLTSSLRWSSAWYVRKRYSWIWGLQSNICFLHRHVQEC